MPTVPTLQNRVQTRPIGGNQLSFNPAQTNQATSRALGQIGEQAFDVAMKQKADADALRIKQATQRLDEFEHSMYDRENGVFSRKGEDALGIEDEVNNEFQNLAGEIEQGLANDTQRQQFAAIKQNRYNQIITATKKYEMREFDSYSREQDQANLEISRNLAVDNYFDKERVNAEINKQATVLLDTARREGWSNEVYRNELARTVSGTHVAVLNRMAEESPVTALAYYEENKDELWGDDEQTADDIISVKAKSYQADDIASEITSTNEAKLSVWRQKAKEIEDPELRKMVVERVESNWRDVELQRSEMVRDTWQQVEQGVNPTKLDNWGQIPSAVKSQMEARYRDLRRGLEPTTDDRAWVQSQALSPTELAGLTQDELFNQYRNKLSDRKFDALVAQWSSARQAVEGNSNQIQQIESVQSSKDRIKSAAITAGMMKADQSLDDLDETDARRYTRFTDNVERRFEEEQFRKGRKLTPTEEQEILDEMTRQTVFVDTDWGFGWIEDNDPEVPVASLVQGDMEEGVYVPADQIPAQPMANMRSLIERNGWTKGNVEERIQRAYAYLLMDNEQAAYEILQGDN